LAVAVALLAAAAAGLFIVAVVAVVLAAAVTQVAHSDSRDDLLLPHPAVGQLWKRQNSGAAAVAVMMVMQLLFPFT
jgi:hypothetical protein